MMQPNFILNIWKPKNITSRKTGSLLKNSWQQKKIGHLGTLDPFASGILPIFGGKYTKLIPYFQQQTKSYLATILLGASSASYDTQEPISYFPSPLLNSYKIELFLKKMHGVILQEAPTYSALKYKGKPLYYYARKNIVVPPKIRKVQIFQLKLIAYKHPRIFLEIVCSKGCYIRSLARDIGNNFKTTAILEELERIQVGNNFQKKNAISLDEALKDGYNKNITLEPWNLLNNYSLMKLEPSAIDSLKKGQSIKLSSKIEQKETFVFLQKQLIAAGKIQEGIFFQPKKLFIEL